MGDLTIKPATGGSLKLQEDGGTDALTIDTSGNTILSGTANNIGTVTSGTFSGTIGTFNIGGTNVTATATELNYVDGVTASIQRQLNSIKANAISLMNTF